MVVTIGLWLTLAPAIGAVARSPGKGKAKIFFSREWLTPFAGTGEPGKPQAVRDHE
jgi:hypothetical protein